MQLFPRIYSFAKDKGHLSAEIYEYKCYTRLCDYSVQAYDEYNQLQNLISQFNRSMHGHISGGMEFILPNEITGLLSKVFRCHSHTNRFGKVDA